MLDLVDIAAVAELSHRAGARLVIDNVFASPLFQRTLELGADVVVYSATKHIDGQGRCLGCAVLGSSTVIDDLFPPSSRNTVPWLRPFNAWQLPKQLDTTDMRYERRPPNEPRNTPYEEPRTPTAQ